VCGEYISNEVLPYLQALGADPLILKPSRIHRFQMSSVKGKTLESRLSLGGFGLSRYSFDQYLMNLAVDRGCRVLRSEEHTSELQSRENLVCRLLPEKKNQDQRGSRTTTTAW